MSVQDELDCFPALHWLLRDFRQLCVNTEIQVPGSGVESHPRSLVTLVILGFRGAVLDGPCLSRSYVQWSTETSELATRLAQQHSSVWCGLRRNLRQVDHHPAGLKAQTFFSFCSPTAPNSYPAEKFSCKSLPVQWHILINLWEQQRWIRQSRTWNIWRVWVEYFR